LIELVEYFESKNVKLISIKENFDTNTPQGKLMLTVFQAFSQFERDLIAQRTKEGLESFWGIYLRIKPKLVHTQQKKSWKITLI
jgi:hypothetical protein